MKHHSRSTKLHVCTKHYLSEAQRDQWKLFANKQISQLTLQFFCKIFDLNYSFRQSTGELILAKNLDSLPPDVSEMQLQFVVNDGVDSVEGNVSTRTYSSNIYQQLSLYFTKLIFF